jgi:transposase
MRIVGCDLHASQQTIAMLDCDTGEISERIIKHEGTAVRDFYAGLTPPILVGIEATGSMGWFVRLTEELGITCRVGDPARIRAIETRRQKHDRRDARLLLTLLTEERFPLERRLSLVTRRPSRVSSQPGPFLRSSAS